MPDLPPALPGIAVPVVAVCLYAAVWLATRGLSGGARALARAVPLAILVPGLVYVSAVLSIEREEAEADLEPPMRTLKAAAPRQTHSIAPASALGSADAISEPKAEVGAAAPAGEPWDVVPVFYGTDRLRKVGPGIDRIAYGTTRAHRLEMGRALVTVPALHRVPSIERPFALRIPYVQVVVYEQAEDPRHHFTVKEVQVLSRERFLALTRERLAASRAFRDQALVFVHGFNTAFDHSLYRTAQIAYDLQFDGAVFLYSWPSAEGLAGYGYDRDSATQAEPFLKEFLALVVKETGARSVSVIAHSMGNLPLLNVLRELGPALPRNVRLDEVILAAPDIDRDVFANLVAAIRPFGRGITLYCSANDRAMSASRRFAGGVPRAGDVPPEGPVVLPGVDTIDVTRTSTDLFSLNHSTYAEKGALLNDIGLLLQTGERPPDRRIPILRKVGTVRGDFWRYP